VEDIKSINRRNWKKAAQNRDSWKKVVEQARTVYRLQRFIRRSGVAAIASICCNLNMTNLYALMYRDSLEYVCSHFISDF